MTINLTGYCRIIFPASNPIAVDLDRITIACWAKILKTYTNEDATYMRKRWVLALSSTDANPYQILFRYPWSTTTGIWTSPNNSIMYNQNHHIAVTYDSTSTSNDPIICVDGSPVEITETATPSGTRLTNANEYLGIGGYYLISSFFGHISDCRIYDRILSTNEIRTLYNSKLQKAVMKGLRFWAPLISAKGISDFEGTSLTSDNTIQDVMSGSTGAPYIDNGAVAGIGNTFQIFGGDHGE